MFAPFPPPRSSSSATRWNGAGLSGRLKPSRLSPATSASPPSSSASSSRPQTAAPRLQSSSHRQSPFLSYPSASSSGTAAKSPQRSRESAVEAAWEVPFCLLDSIHSHQQAARSPQRSRPHTAQRTRPALPSTDNSPVEPSPHSTLSHAPTSSASTSTSPFLSPTTSHRQSRRESELSHLEREIRLQQLEERKEADEPCLPSANVSPLRRSPPSVAVQRSIHLLHASPLLAQYLPQLSSIDSRWSSLLSHQTAHRRTEAQAMSRLRVEERQVRDGLLAFLRVSMEYRRVDVHDEDGRVVGEGSGEEVEEGGEVDGEGEGVGRGWLVLDDDQSGSLDVDWNGRYWRSERRREKEAWHRREERLLHALYERGVQAATRLYERRFSQLHDFAKGSQLSGKNDAVSLQLQTELHEVLTALSPSLSTSTSASLLPPPHPSLSQHRLRLHSQLSSLSSLLSSHYQRVFSVIEHAHSLTSSSSTLDAMLSAMQQEERERRDEVDDLREQLRAQKEEASRREEEWKSKLRVEQLETWKEREEVHRAQRQMAVLHDALQRIEATRKAEEERKPLLVDAEAQGDGGAGPLRREHWEPQPGNSEWRRAGRVEEEGKPRLALQLGGSEAALSPKALSPTSRPPMSARSLLSAAAALAAADRGGLGSANGGKPLAASKTQREAEKAGGGEAEPEGPRAKKWDGVPFV